MITKIIRSSKKTHIQDPARFTKNPSPYPVLCCVTKQGVRMPVRDWHRRVGWSQSHSAECGVAVCCKASITVRAAGFSLPWLFLWLLWHVSKSLLRASLPVTPKLGDEPQTWCRLWDCMSRKINLSFSVHVCSS